MQCLSFLALIVKRRADTLARCRAESWFSAWRWRRLPRMRPWAEPVGLHREQAGTPKQLIARMLKRNLRPALRACFGTPRINDAWPGTAWCGLAPELTDIPLAQGAVGRKAGVARTATAPRDASGSEPVGDTATSNSRAPHGQDLALRARADVAEADFVLHACPVDCSHVNSWRMHERRCRHL